MRNLILTVFATSAIAGCASEIMKGYVGKDITEVIIERGPPINVMELPDGRTAFQWSQDVAYSVPTTTNIYDYGSYASATSYGGGTYSYECVYTVFGQKNERNSYTVTGFQPPSFSCE